jgi:hypothetical protein
MTIKQFVVTNAFRFSMVWDLLTTFLGTLIILGKMSFIPVGISLVGTLIVGALNFATKAIWSSSYTKRLDFFFQYLLLRTAWVLAIVFDFWTSLTCNALFVAPDGVEIGKTNVEFTGLLSQLTPGQTIIVLFVTILATISPMMVGYIRDKDLEFLT